MKSTRANWLLVTLGLILGSYVYQAFGNQDWQAATLHSYDAATTMLFAWIAFGRTNATKDTPYDI